MIARTLRAVVLAALVLSSAGCGVFGGGEWGDDPYWGREGPDLVTPRVPPGTWQKTPAGGDVYVPLWLDLETHAERKALAMKFLDETGPEVDPNLGAEVLEGVATPGIPPGARVWILDPGLFSTSSSPTGLAAGMTNMTSDIWVPWRRVESDARPLPAYGHELGHWWYWRATGRRDLGSCAGHGTCPLLSGEASAHAGLAIDEADTSR